MTAHINCGQQYAAQSQRRRKRTPLIAILSSLLIALLFSGCGISNAVIGGVPPGPPATHNNAWLSYKVSRNCGSIASCAGLLDFDDTNGLSEASKYYCSIGVDPTGCASGNTPQYDFVQWKADYGFPASGFPAAHAFYFNKGDLQLGRDMNCVQSGPNIACYVSNYGPPPFKAGKENPLWPNPDAALNAAINQTPLTTDPDNGLFATVAMVFNPSGVGPNGDQVTFYVFGADGKLLNNAALDGEGGKSVPRMCMACHGGAYTADTNGSFPFSSKAPGINFLPFDVFFFHYQEGDPTNSLGNPDLQEGFRQLNHLVAITHRTPSPTPADAAILESIDDQYNHSLLCGDPTKNQLPCVDVARSQVPADPPPPAGWTSQPELYRNVFRPYCRMCHLGQSPKLANGGVRDLTFRDVNALSAPVVHNFVCNLHDMPHAEVPLGGQSGSNLRVGLWWDLQALDSLNAFLINNGQPACQ
jgi:hypothetical protein